jgi:hypothetical protein
MVLRGKSNEGRTSRYQETRLAWEGADVLIPKKRGRLSKLVPPRLLSLLDSFLNYLKPDFPARLDPATCDLRYFWWHRVSTEPDGESIPETGSANRLLFYGSDVVARLATIYKDGVEVSTLLHGDKEILQVAEVSEKFKQVCAIANHIAGKARMDRFDSVIPMTPVVFSRLRRHPQTLKLKLMWVNEGFDLRIEQVDMRSAKVVLARFGQHKNNETTGRATTPPSSARKPVPILRRVV